MSIVTECDACGKKYRFPDHLAGSSLPCKECGTEIDVPGAKLSRSRSRTQAPAPSINWVPWAAGGGGVVLVVVLLFVMFGGKSTPTEPPSAPVVANNTAVVPQLPHNNRPANDPLRANPNSSNDPSSANPFANNRIPGNNIPRNAQQVADDPAANFENFIPKMNEKASDEVPANWNAQVDPAPEEYVLDPATPLKLNLKFPRQGTSMVLYPATRSPFVLLGGNRNSGEESQIFDLRSGSRVGRLRGIEVESNASVALSPDAQYLAATRGFGFKKSVVVWDIKSGQVLWNLSTNEAQGVAFLSPSRLLEVRSDSAVVWDMKSGTEIRTIAPLEFSWQLENECLSPNGRYLAQIVGTFSTEVIVTDLETGESVGKLNIPEDAKTHGQQSLGLAFSPDGTELAALFGFFDTGHIIVWDFRTGRLVKDCFLNDSYQTVQQIATFYKGPKLHWFPDNQRWLIHGHGIADRNAEKVIYVFPNDDSGFPRIPLTSSQLLAVTGNRGNIKLEAIDLPEEGLSKAVETIQLGGVAMDAELPPLAIAKRDQSKQVKLAVVANTKVPADPAPEPVKGLLSRKKSVKLPRGEGNFAQLFLSDGASGRMLVTHKTEHNRFYRWGEPLAFQIWLELYDLRTGAQLPGLEIPYPSDAIAFSPSGRYAALRLANRQDRLDIWDVKERKYVTGFRPYFDPAVKAEQRDQILNDYREFVDARFQIEAAQFIDDEHVITINARNQLSVWALPECREVYRFDYTGTPGISPGKNYLAAKSGEHLHLIGSRTGEIVASLPADGRMESAAFHNNGKLLAVVLEKGADHFLCYWDLSTGEQLGRFPIPMRGNSLRFCNEQQVLLNDSLLLDLKREAVAWTYDSPQNTYLPLAPDHRIWYYGAEDAQRRELYLTAVELPEPAVAEKINKSPLAAEYLPLSGKKIKMETSIESAPNTENFDGEIRTDYSAKIVTIGAQESSLAEIDLKIGLTTKLLDSETWVYFRHRPASAFSGAPVYNDMFMGRREIVDSANATFEKKQAFCTWELIYQGYPVWRQMTTLESGHIMDPNLELQINSMINPRLTSGESAARASSNYQNRFWGNVRAVFKARSLPTFLFAPGSEKGLGTSYFTTSGLSDRPE